MADNKRSKEVTASTSLVTATYGALPSTGSDGIVSVMRGSQSGVLYVSITDADGSAGATANDPKATGTPSGVNVMALFETTLPTYVNGDPVVLHTDDRGRLLVSAGEGVLSADVDTDQAAGPAAPKGQYMIGKREATLPTYADGDNSVFHFDVRGRQIVTQINPTTGVSPDIDTDDTAATANPSGSYSLGLYEATLPTYTDGDAAAPHADSRGRTITRDAPAGTSATSNVVGVAANVTLLAANTARIGGVIYNDSTADLSIKLGAVASATSFTVRLVTNTYYPIPANYTGIIEGIWASATGNARVTEIS
jgi:hypothetical protein